MAPHSRINTDVKPVREIDIENASKDELIEYLCQTIHYEVEKGEDADCDLIRECSDWLDELTADLMVFTPEELEAKLEALKAGKDVPISQQHKPHQTASTPRIKRKVFARVGILVASLMLLSVLSLSVLAKHAGYGSAWEYTYVNLSKLLGLNLGDEFKDDGITVIKNTGSATYKNMAEFLSSESIDIIYPHNMPNDIEIIKIHVVERADNNFMMYFTFSDDRFEFNVANYYLLAPEDTYERVTINNLNYYIQKINDDLYYAMLQHNGFEYTIQAPSYDDILIILNNMKG